MKLTRFFTRVAVENTATVSNKNLAKFKELIMNVKYLTSFNIVHLDSYAITPEARKQIKVWVNYLVESGKQFANLDVNHPEQIQRNAAAILAWVYEAIPKVKEAFTKYLPQKNIPPTVQNTLNLYREIVEGAP